MSAGVRVGIHRGDAKDAEVAQRSFPLRPLSVATHNFLFPSKFFSLRTSASPAVVDWLEESQPQRAQRSAEVWLSGGTMCSLRLRGETPALTHHQPLQPINGCAILRRPISRPNPQQFRQGAMSSIGDLRRP